MFPQRHEPDVGCITAMIRTSIPFELIESPAQDRLRRPLHDLRISVIDRCNFRCPYCMPEEKYPRNHAFLRAEQRLSFDEIERVARLFVRLGVRKLRLTGGEPLLRRNLPDLIKRLSAIAQVEDVALTTNGVLLEQQAASLRDAGLQRLTVSLDSLDSATFRALSGGRGEVEQVLEGIYSAERAGFQRIKINCVVMRGINDGQVLELAERFRGTGHVLRLIEYMDVGTCNGWQEKRVVPAAQLRARIEARWPLRPLSPNYGGEVAKRFAYADGAGEIGFIASVTEPFCGECSRARLSSDGKIYTCLFTGEGHDLRQLLRSGACDADLACYIAACWRRRVDRYSELRSQINGENAAQRVEMYAIGG